MIINLIQFFLYKYYKFKAGELKQISYRYPFICDRCWKICFDNYHTNEVNKYSKYHKVKNYCLTKNKDEILCSNISK